MPTLSKRLAWALPQPFTVASSVVGASSMQALRIRPALTLGRYFAPTHARTVSLCLGDVSQPPRLRLMPTLSERFAPRPQCIFVRWLVDPSRIPRIRSTLTFRKRFTLTQRPLMRSATERASINAPNAPWANAHRCFERRRCMSPSSVSENCDLITYAFPQRASIAPCANPSRSLQTKVHGHRAARCDAIALQLHD